MYWRGFLKPTSASLEYLVQIDLAPGFRAIARVLAPPLLVDRFFVRSRRDHLHVSSDGALCLYHPTDEAYRPGCLVADTIVPRVLHWLKLYELWLRTGRWCSKQAPPGKPNVLPGIKDQL